MWLCRALSLTSSTNGPTRTPSSAGSSTSGSLLPSEDEHERARDYFLVGAVLALSQARVNADNHPGQWWAAVATSPDREFKRRIGRIYADREADEAGDYVTRFILLVASPPSDLTLRSDWREFLLAQILGPTSPSRPHTTVCRPGRTVNRMRSLTSKRSLAAAMKPTPTPKISFERTRLCERTHTLADAHAREAGRCQSLGPGWAGR